MWQMEMNWVQNDFGLKPLLLFADVYFQNGNLLYMKAGYPSLSK